MGPPPLFLPTPIPLNCSYIATNPPQLSLMMTAMYPSGSISCGMNFLIRQLLVGYTPMPHCHLYTYKCIHSHAPAYNTYIAILYWHY